MAEYGYNNSPNISNLESNGGPSWFAQIGRGLSNTITGDLDYARELEMLGYTQNFNSAEALKNRQWQEYMSNTAYQRAVKDMSSAGLNPYLAYSQGGASVGSGATASSSGSHTGKSGEGFLAIMKLVGSLAGDAMSMAGRIATAQMQSNTARENLDTRAKFENARLQAYQDYLDDKFSAYDYHLAQRRK